MQYESDTKFMENQSVETKYMRHNLRHTIMRDDNRMYDEPLEAEKNNFTHSSLIILENDLIKNMRTCIRLVLCPVNYNLTEQKCINDKDNEELIRVFNWTIKHPYQKIRWYKISAPVRFMSFFYTPPKEQVIKNISINYSHSINYTQNETGYNIITEKRMEITIYSILVTIAIVASLPCLLATVIVYSILPEMQNIHGYMLRAYVSSLFVAYMIIVVHRQTSLSQLGYTFCFILAVIYTFSSMATFFWQNIMCFDIWWMFRKPYSSRRKFGFVRQNFKRPEFCIHNHWFTDRITSAYYFYIPIGITIFCNILLFISTALTIARHRKNMDQHLKNSVNEEDDDTKQWSKMYIKLFILMGITWINEIMTANDMSVLDDLRFIWYPIDIINALQGVIIFIIFVWKKKIRLTLMKRC
ncbi:hypothetical protein HN011_005111 [Eciton burchellii]|nr:hypothetical protein HN011_005111 [Eciton burchellii]